MKFVKNNKLIVLATAMMLVGISLSAFTLWYMITNQPRLESKLQENLKAELAKYNFPNIDKITPDEAEMYIAVAKYCEANNNCKGPTGNNGINGTSPECLNLTTRCQGVNGTAPTKGIDYGDGMDGLTPPCYFNESQCQGSQGVPGEPAKPIERQCNAEKRRVEWRNQGETNWQVEYKLAPLQTCETEGF